ncbi:cytochrome P450 [Purpureocillium lavendulum]|uniref:Mediator of RNA polymerase II transcription subunit 19 n=1 Tax=Purpureocillium lavendulum TaxID=1247861 RepID=A0AB34FHN2_9HYPO|nr:cytochrome P450 [Purpureocillium lavendulum]
MSAFPIMSFHPQTPQSPCNFSPATSSDPMTGLSAASAATSTTTLPTPAHSVNGCNSQPDTAMSEESPHKRKRPLDDVGDRDQKKMHLEDRKLGIEDLHLDVGDKYLLCHTQPLPRTSEDLYAKYGLAGLAAEVAREKPNGEKNALRKTYKGHIKRLGVAGHFDVQKKKEGEPSDFLAMLQVPELEWNVHQVKGREIGDGLSQATVSALGRAMTMAKGPIPKGVWDSSVLGDLAPGGGEASKPVSAKPSAPNTPLAPSPNAMGRSKPQVPTGQDLLRPRRNVMKRSYGDSSYEGYQEGFPDDDTGYSTGEGEGGQKRRKKVGSSEQSGDGLHTSNAEQSSESTPPYPTMRQQSYGPGMVGA